MSLQWSLWSVRSRFGAFVSAGKISFPSNGDFGFKLAGNMMTATTLEVLGEVMALIRKRGLNPETFVDILTATMFGGRVHRIYGGKIAAQHMRRRDLYCRSR